MSDEVTRRSYLQALLATGVVASTAGCNSSQDTSSTETTGTPTATSNQAPQILTHDATPQDNGTALAVHLEGEDDHGLSLARVEYGPKSVERSPDNTAVTIDDEFSELSATDLDETPGQVTYLLRDTDGKETRIEEYPDETAPELESLSVESTRNARELTLQLEGSDDIGLEVVELLLSGQLQLQEDVSGQINTEQRVDIPENATFQQHTATVSLKDWNGNTTESEVGTYVRKYNVMEDTRLEIGVNYVLWAGDKFGECIEEVQPEIGQYSYPTSPEVRSNHIDQMQGFGITNALINFNGTENDRESVAQFMEAQLADQIALRPIYAIKDYRWNPDSQNINWKGELLPEDMEFLRENILSRDNVVTYEGRPVFNIWNATSLAWGDDYRNKILEEWGSFQNFTEDLRSLLNTGKDPFIVGGATGSIGYHDFEYASEEMIEFLTSLDALTTWPGGAWGKDNQATWDEVLNFQEQNYDGHRKFVNENDMEFIPMVFPGFDDRMNTCWGQDRLTPRSQEQFKDLLELADEYRTTDMIDIATWNDWTEGTQIEPGSFRETEYGTEYLKIVQEFQRAT